ncbi:hypothetical protein EV659_1161, partial [Rhodothalassium salexigens DSM 2132]
MLLSLGGVRFEVGAASYDQLRRADRWRWSAHARIGRAEAIQFTGREAATIDLDGTLYPGQMGNPGQIGGDARALDRLRALADAGRPLDLVAGTGAVLGLWVIVSIEDAQGPFFADG